MASLNDSYEAVPPGFSFPSSDAYAGALVEGIGGIAGDVWTSVDAGGILTPPIAAGVGTVAAVFEELTGLGMDELVKLAASAYGLSQATSSAELLAGTYALIEGAVDLGIKAAVAGGAIAANAVQAVPILGQIIGAVMGFIVELMKSEARYDQAQEACMRRAAQDRDAACASLLRTSIPRATGPNGLDPTDLFRPLAYEWHRRLTSSPSSTAYPANATAMYVGLCGGEAQVLSMWSAEQYLEVCKQTKTPPIPQTTQRKMWGLIRALMMGARNPTPSGGAIPKPDGGRALFPALQDIVNNERARGRVTPALLQRVAEAALDWTRLSISCKDLVKGEIAAGAVPWGWAWCVDRIDLVTPFWRGLEEYDWRLRWQYAPDGHWQLAPRRPLRLSASALKAMSRGTLVLTDAAVDSISRGAGRQLEAIARERRRRLIAGGGVAVLGAAAAAAIMRWL